MFNEKRLAKFLATGVMPEMTALDESLAEHDKKYHPNGYNDGDECKKRDKSSKLDEADKLLREGIASGILKSDFKQFKVGEKVRIRIGSDEGKTGVIDKITASIDTLPNGTKFPRFRYFVKTDDDRKKYAYQDIESLGTENDGEKKIDEVFKITSPRIKPDGAPFDYHRYGMAYAERQPIKIDGRAYALADHCVDGRLRELVGESSDINFYDLFFDGGVFESEREIEDILGVRTGDSEGDYAVVSFGSEKELLDAYDKLNKQKPAAFDEDHDWKSPKGTPSDVFAYKIKRDFYDAIRQNLKGKTTYDIDKGIGIICALSDQELDDFAWTYKIGKYDKDKDKGNGNGEKSELYQAVEMVMSERNMR